MDGYPEVVKRFTVSKNKQGITGPQGPVGPQGEP